MAEPQNGGGERRPDIHTTAKLPPEPATSSTTQAGISQSEDADTGIRGQEQVQAPETVDQLQLLVVEGFQVGRGAARIDPSDIARLGCKPGDIVMISGARTTAARIAPSSAVEREQKTI